MTLCLLVLLLENYKRLFKIKRQQKIHITTGQNKQIKNVFAFKPLTYYNTYSIDDHTTIETLDLLLKEAKKSKEFTIVFQNDHSTNLKLTYIEFFFLLIIQYIDNNWLLNHLIGGGGDIHK